MPLRVVSADRGVVDDPRQPLRRHPAWRLAVRGANLNCALFLVESLNAGQVDRRGAVGRVTAGGPVPFLSLDQAAFRLPGAASGEGDVAGRLAQSSRYALACLGKLPGVRSFSANNSSSRRLASSAAAMERTFFALFPSAELVVEPEVVRPVRVDDQPASAGDARELAGAA
jgi:hypothetical protein